MGLLVVGAATIAGYALTYLATYAQDTLKLGAQLAFVATIAQGAGYLSCAYAAGWLGDRFGHRRVLVLSLTLLLALMLPAFVLINRWPTAASLFLVTATLSIIHMSAIVCMQAFLIESLTPTVRSGVFAMSLCHRRGAVRRHDAVRFEATDRLHRKCLRAALVRHRCAGGGDGVALTQLREGRVRAVKTLLP